MSTTGSRSSTGIPRAPRSHSSTRPSAATSSSGCSAAPSSSRGSSTELAGWARKAVPGGRPPRPLRWRVDGAPGRTGTIEAREREHGRPRTVSAKYVFVTGGVVSSLGKGITAASLGRLLKARGLKVQVQKFDPYINVDPGTMSPFQHGEVLVTEDGAETALDIGHYDRSIDENLPRSAHHTSGSVWYSVLRKERKGEDLGSTVQVIPHITNEIKERIR